MKTTPSYIAAFLLSVPGLAVYFLNPNRSISLFGGLLLQLLGVSLVFTLTIPQKAALDKYKRYAKENSKENRSWLIASLVIYLLCGVMVLIGIKSGFLRFVLFFIMWGGAVAAGEFAGFFIWHHNNKAWVAEELKKDAIEAEKLKQKNQEARNLAAERTAERQKAEAAAKEKAAQQAAKRDNELPEEKKQPQKIGVVTISDHERVHRKNRGEYMENMVDGLTAPMIQAFQFHLSMVQSAAADPRVLAGVEEAIARLAKHKDITFYRPSSSMKNYSKEEIQKAYDHMIDLARQDALLNDPALTQALALIVDAQGNMGSKLLNELSQYGLSFQAYQLLGMQFTLSNMNR